MAPRAQIGFHAASDRETGKVTSVGNALIGAYLNKIGLPYTAVVYITTAAPEAISWLSKSDAEKLGIEVSFYDARDEPTGTSCFGSEDCKDHQRQYCFGPEDCKIHPDYLPFDTPTNPASTKRATALTEQPEPSTGSTWGLMFKQQVERCWKKPYGGIDERPEAAFAIRLKRDGTRQQR
jgi:hypothetical protein